MTELKGKIALVTGGSKGIGAATVRKLAGLGADVHFTYSASADAAKKVADEASATAYKLDAAKPDEMKDFADHFVSSQRAPDILVHNAGVFSGGPIGALTLDEYRRVFDVNVASVFALTNALVPQMQAGSRIVLISSVLGERASTAALSIYNASKFAVNGFVRSGAKDLGAAGILVNAVQPGPINTDMNPDSADNEAAEFMKSLTALGRYGQADEIAAAVAFLAGPGATYITGTTLNVDGGWNA